MSFAPDGHLFLVDPGNVRISEYDVSESTFRFVTSFRNLPFGADLCWIDGRMVVGGMSEASLLHVVDSTGAALRSFAEVQIPNEELARVFDRLADLQRMNMNQALVACSRTGTTVLVQRSMPIVRAFDAAGDLRWRTELTGLDYLPRWWANDRGIVSFTGKQDTVEEAAAVAIGDDERIYITYWKAGLIGPEYELELRILRLDDGQEVARLPVGGRVFAVRNGLAYLYDQAPFPHAVVVRMNRVPGG
jgi:hypothetical protein